MDNGANFADLGILFERLPDAVAVISGSEIYPNIGGQVMFYNVGNGVIVRAEIFDLPYENGKCLEKVFGFHIHDGSMCKGTADDPFAAVGSHFNPAGCPHPMHAGDMPPLFGVKGYALSVFLTDRFTVEDIIGKTVIIHGGHDDFTTQPSGNSGQKIACGTITAVRRY